MKIAQVVPSLEARHGGPSRSVRGLARGLAGCDLQVDLLTTGPFDDEGPELDGKLVTRTFPRGRPEALAPATGLRSYLATQRYGIVHHHGLWQRTLHYAQVAARESWAPLVISPRGMMCPWAWRHRRWKKWIAERVVHPGAFTAAAGWHATSAAEADDIRALGFTQPICVVPNGVDPPSASIEAAAAHHWRSLLPTLLGRRVALFYSRFHSKKRVLELIDLWASRPRGDWVLLLVGIPEDYSVAMLDAYVRDKNAATHIIVESGAGRPSPYAIASLLVLPSHSENFGLVVAEALVRGVPVLTTDTTPWHDLAAYGAGQCVAWEDFPAALALQLAMPPATLRASGERGRTWAETTFSWSKAAKALAEFYGQLIDA